LDEGRERFTARTVAAVGHSDGIGCDHLKLLGQGYASELIGDVRRHIRGVHDRGVGFAQLDFGDDLTNRVLTRDNVLFDAALEIGAISGPPQPNKPARPRATAATLARSAIGSPPRITAGQALDRAARCS
jgi:hypothetical protein